MKHYFVLYENKQENVLTKEIYYAHIAHLKKCEKDGILFIAGPLKDHNKIIQIIRADSIENATQKVKEDSYIASGYYRSFQIFEWIEANADNEYLMKTERGEKILSSLV